MAISERIAALIDGVRRGDRALLARAITLVESSRATHRGDAQAMLNELLPATGGSWRIGITGVPGVGKSTFIDAFGSMLTVAGHKVAVLAVDPSSQRTGGSILGDKTRMARLSVDTNSFIRPSPASGALGGVARMTRETMLLCEAAGFDVVLVETVGVGQSETMVAEMVDFFLVLALPGAGDELQGIKKGVLEIADLIAVNKADGDNRFAAEQAAQHYRRALHILEPVSPDWRPPVVLVSGLQGDGLEALWQQIEAHRQALEKSGELEAKRQGQQVRWMRSMLEARLLDMLKQDPSVASLMAAAERQVRAGEVTPAAAVDQVFGAFARAVAKS